MNLTFEEAVKKQHTLTKTLESQPGMSRAYLKVLHNVAISIIAGLFERDQGSSEVVKEWMK